MALKRRLTRIAQYLRSSDRLMDFIYVAFETEEKSRELFEAELAKRGLVAAAYEPEFNGTVQVMVKLASEAATPLVQGS